MFQSIFRNRTEQNEAIVKSKSKKMLTFLKNLNKHIESIKCVNFDSPNKKEMPKHMVCSTQMQKLI